MSEGQYGQYELVMNTEIEDFNLELLQDYWSFSNIERNIYTFTMKDLLKKYDIGSPSKLERIVKQCGYLKFSELKDCKKCYFHHEIFIRKHLSPKRKYYFEDSLNCRDCLRINIQNYFSRYLNEFKLCIPTLTESPISPPQQQLSYLEKIVLYVMLTKIKIGTDNILPQHEWHSFIELEGNGASDLVRKIFEKGYLFKTNDFDEFIKRQDDLRELYSECRQHLNEDMKHEIQTYLSANFRANINVVIPEYYTSLEQWVLGLYQEVMESKIYIQDYKQIENYLKNKRLNEVYALLDFVCEYKKIPNKKNNALELDLIRMLLKFDLQHIFSLFWYQAKFASDRLRTLELSGDEQSRFMKDFVFSKKIASYLDYLEKVNEKLKFPRSLPENWSYSDIEVFISAHIIGNYEKWEKFTPSEILTLWEEAKGIELEYE